MNNFHSPTDSWVQALCVDNGYESEAEIGDKGSMYLERPSGTYEITAEKVDE